LNKVKRFYATANFCFNIIKNCFGELLRFTLRNKKWYACEFIGDEFDQDKCSYSPIRIIDIKPHGNGNRIITLKFFHANYPQGVQNEIDTDWLKRHFPHKELDRLDCKAWLDRYAN